MTANNFSASDVNRQLTMTDSVRRRSATNVVPTHSKLPGYAGGAPRRLVWVYFRTPSRMLCYNGPVGDTADELHTADSLQRVKSINETATDWCTAQLLWRHPLIMMRTTTAATH